MVGVYCASGAEAHYADFDADSCSLRKTLPGMNSLPALPVEEGVILWWKSVFQGDAEIDVANIPDRKVLQTSLLTFLALTSMADEEPCKESERVEGSA
eukprot:761555-Hanusia_phi.AAC.4